MTTQPYSYSDTLLRVNGISVTKGDNPVLRDLSLEIKDLHVPGRTQGQVVSLLGPSGMGKTTLFRILAGLDAPDSGTVLLEKDGRPVQRGMVGVVAQHYPLFTHRTVIGNMLVAGRHGDAREKATELLKRFGLEAHAQKYPAQLSGGQRQRAAIAQQFMCSEHFLLMDEPFTGLDLLAEENLYEFIKEMAATDELATFIVVTHNIDAAIAISDTLWILGRDRDAEGKPIPGARIQATYNLLERGLAWRKGVSSTPEYHALVQEIRELFPRL